MPEGIDEAASAFARAIDPSPQPGEGAAGDRTPRRDDAGRFAAVAEKPEPFLQIRMLEGDPETGDTSDAGDDPRLRQRERDVADGRFDERQDVQAQRQSRQAAAETVREGRERSLAEPGEERGRTAADDGHSRAADGEDNAEADAAGDEAGEGESGDDDLENSQFEITVDGTPQTVSLGELRDGYIRTATFHSRLNKVNERKQEVDQENARVVQMRDLYINGLYALDQDLQALAPTEPDWDKEYERDPLSARRRQKEFEAYHQKLNTIRGQRAWAIQNAREEHDRASAKYAVEQFTQFVAEHSKLIKDEPTLQRVIGGMRKTALAEGFNEVEVAGVYDKRMLNILLKAWLYDQGMAVRPQAVLPGSGRSLVPGSARPINGSAGRRNIDEASKQLARTGKLEDATAYFQRLLS
jgi:hypothetical protein